METPLSPAQGSNLNIQTPATAQRYDSYEVRTVSASSESQSQPSQGSSPFVSALNDTALSDQENHSPSKSRHSRVLSGSTLSPLKILTDQREVRDGRSTDRLSPNARSPRKVSPEKRFPVKISNPLDTTRAASQESTMSLEDAVRQNEGLKRAIEIFEDEQSVLEDGLDDMDVTTGTINVNPSGEMEVDDSVCPDDTAISTFSTFSAVPNLTMFAKLGQSPTKLSDMGGLTPRANTRADPSPSRTSRTRPRHDSGNTTNLLDFTEQLRFPQRSPQKSPVKGRLSPSRTAPDMTATPSRGGFANLIDFDIPPMPTPRSVPSITARELESLKSNFLSEISSLKASLSGKEAEVQSLKAAVGDAEKRVGESQEQLREERSIKEQLTAEKEGWENRGREMEHVLRKAKEEIVESQREQEELEQKLEESEKRREAAEMLHQEAESKMAGMRAGKDTDKSSPEKPKSPNDTNHEVEIAVERVARELHALYKSKHESKVTALKKSYETRWEKRVHELESKIRELVEENERLRVCRDTTMSRVEPDNIEADERKAQAVRDSAAIKELNADIQRLEAVVHTVQLDNESLRSMLEKERVEKGELVQLAEEMMSMQSFVAQTPKPQPQPQQQAQQPPSASRYPHERQHDREPETKTPKRSADHFRSSVSRASGLRAPGSGLRAPHERTKSAGGLPRPGGMTRSGIMNSIEKMGNYRGRGAE
ncbi:kinetoplast-associated KAP [Fusarium mundagurra]|uniref:Kinetoplast-associated KAP n=1 Tax=Fusarium mundagurra TaxID=1567541 RepID=A0A8H6CYE1_9HYPO|nr:kinetoplast-associated KAP [Fusarium mundagurra]